MAEKKGQDIEVWRQVFQMLIQEVKPRHKWTLTADKGLLPNVLQPGWLQYQLWTFARFQCSFCSRSWASAHVQVLFHMHWSEKKHQGQVKMRVFAQRCKRCPQPPFEVPEFTQENISRVLNNLVIRILKKCYREGFKIVEEIPAIKDVCLQGPHDSNNCEACLQGSCAQSGLDLAKQSPVPTPSKDAGEPRLTAACTSPPCAQPASKVDKLLISAVGPKASNPPKADSQVRHSSEPPTAQGILTSQGIITSQVSPRSTVNPKVPNTPKADSKVRHSSEPPTAPRFLSPQMSPTSTMNLKVPSPPKADLKVRHSSEPPTAPRLPTQQVPPISSLAPRPATQMPSPTKTHTAADAGARVTRPKTGNALPSSSLLARPTRTTNLPTSWIPEANTVCQVERRIQIYPSNEHFYSSPSQNCIPQRCSTSCCCLLLLIVIVTVILAKSYI